MDIIRKEKNQIFYNHKNKHIPENYNPLNPQESLHKLDEQ